MNKKEKIEYFLKKGILLSPETVEEIDVGMETKLSKDVLVIDRKRIEAIKIQKNITPVRVIYNYTKESKKREYGHFVRYFNHRYKALERMIRPRMDRLMSIQRVLDKRDREGVSIIGIISKKSETKKGNMILELEDQTGKINVVVNKEKQVIYSQAKDMVLDEVIGVSGVCGNKVVFAEDLLHPDVPIGRELKKSPNDTNVVFISDIEFGSKNFMLEEWGRFMEWICGDDEKVKKVKYLFIVGDLVAGVGIYPGQEEDLEVIDIREQYNIFIEQVKKIPSRINIIICTGNHDAGRLAEPQLPLYKDFSESLYELPNITMVSNPSVVNIDATQTFPGIEVMMYHGFSMPYYADNVETIRGAGGQKRPDMIMEFYMKRRHLAPTHTSNLYIPDTEHDPLVIEKVPDILATGHIHRTSASNYRGVSLLNCSAWTKATENQIKRGLDPQPARAVIVNLKTREMETINFNESKQ